MASDSPPAAALRALLNAFEVMDFDTVGRLIADDAQFDFPYGGQAPVKGRAAILDFLRVGMATFLKSMDFTIAAIHPAADPELVFAEYSSTGVMTNDRPYANRYICLLRASGGKITLFREFYNPAAIAAAKA